MIQNTIKSMELGKCISQKYISQELTINNNNTHINDFHW